VCPQPYNSVARPTRVSSVISIRSVTSISGVHLTKDIWPVIIHEIETKKIIRHTAIIISVELIVLLLTISKLHFFFAETEVNTEQFGRCNGMEMNVKRDL
jgi:hypothetical protein